MKVVSLAFNYIKYRASVQINYPWSNFPVLCTTIVDEALQRVEEGRGAVRWVKCCNKRTECPHSPLAASPQLHCTGISSEHGHRIKSSCREI
jgi:hypothetical protein